MPNYNSPLTNKKFATTALREFDVENADDIPETPTPRRPPSPPDENAIRDFQLRMQQMQQQDIDPEAEAEIRRAREEKRSGREKMSDGAKKRIEILIGMTRLTRTFELDGNVYVLQTLKSKELREAYMAAAEFDGTVQSPFEIRKQLLARSLVQIAGYDTSQFISSNTLEAKLEFIDDQDHAFLSRVNNEYILLIKEADEKYSIKNPEDVKEVLEDLKK